MRSNFPKKRRMGVDGITPLLSVPKLLEGFEMFAIYDDFRFVGCCQRNLKEPLFEVMSNLYVANKIAIPRIWTKTSVNS